MSEEDKEPNFSEVNEIKKEVKKSEIKDTAKLDIEYSLLGNKSEYSEELVNDQMDEESPVNLNEWSFLKWIGSKLLFFTVTRKRMINNVNLIRQNQLRDMFLKEKKTAVDRYKFNNEIIIDPRSIMEFGQNKENLKLVLLKILEEEIRFQDELASSKEQACNNDNDPRKIATVKEIDLTLSENNPLLKFSTDIESILYLVDSPTLLKSYRKFLKNIWNVYKIHSENLDTNLKQSGEQSNFNKVPEKETDLETEKR